MKPWEILYVIMRLDPQAWAIWVDAAGRGELVYLENLGEGVYFFDLRGT